MITMEQQRKQLEAAQTQRNACMQRERMWRRVTMCLFVLLLLLISLGAFDARADDRRYEYDAEIVRIVDGDTYVMRLHIYPGAALIQHVRLDEWDTPERRGKCPHEKALAADAAIAAGLWFSRAGGTVRAYLSDIDAFGRPIARLVSPEGSLGDALAAAGLALPFKRGRTEKWCGV